MVRRVEVEHVPALGFACGAPYLDVMAALARISPDAVALAWEGQDAPVAAPDAEVVAVVADVGRER